MNAIDRSLVFIVGAQRSGTTWLQRLLAAHPAVAGGQESHLFSSYLAPMWQRWRKEAEMRVNGWRTVGLACYLSEDELLEEMRGLARRVLGKLLQAKSGATLLVEKTPDHGLHLPLIHRLFPDAVVLHMLRDGRDVVASLLDASRHAWGRGWAPEEPRAAARLWRDWVGTIRQDQPLFARTRTIRYEELVEDGPETLGWLLAFLGLPLDGDGVRGLLERWNFDGCEAPDKADDLIVREHVRASRLEPAGFHRAGRSGGWRATLTPDTVQAVEEEAGDLLRELGYADPKPQPLPAEPLPDAYVSESLPDDPCWVYPKNLHFVGECAAQMAYRERLLAYALAMAQRPERCLEIGACEGGATRLLAAALDDLGFGKLIALDPAPRWAPELRESLAERVSFLEEKSPAALPAAKELAGGLFDFVLRDGDITGLGTLCDLRGLAEVVRPGATVLMLNAFLPGVRAGIEEALRQGLPFADAGMMATTPHRVRVGEERLTFGGIRLLLRAPDPEPPRAVGPLAQAMRRFRRLFGAAGERLPSARSAATVSGAD